jgi:hypothetical protein
MLRPQFFQRGVAAYLEAGDTRASIRVGVLAGLLLWLPVTPPLLVGLALLPFDFGLSFLIILFGITFAGIYTIGLSALGGYLAAYLMKDPRIGGRNGRESEPDHSP